MSMYISLEQNIVLSLNIFKVYLNKCTIYMHLFIENCINKDVIANLTSDLMKELIPQVGLRIKFNKKWQEHFKKIEDITNVGVHLSLNFLINI